MACRKVDGKRKGGFLKDGELPGFIEVSGRGRGELSEGVEQETV